MIENHVKRVNPGVLRFIEVGKIRRNQAKTESSHFCKGQPAERVLEAREEISTVKKCQ